ncbi:MAG: DUF192 domain-containing protein [Candidatus Levybacteria bacterium]|nr:DUF192 domain-containing protein [Candidatus Levybacteria bacterium]
MMQRIIIIFAAVLVISGLVLLARNIFGGKQESVTVGDEKIQLFVAKTTKEHEVGLSNRTSLKENQGMIFLFDKPDYYSFWMRNMKFPIDIIFLSGNKIVTMHVNVQPPAANNASLPLYTSDEPADKVIELPAGKSEKLDLKDGDTLSLTL